MKTVNFGKVTIGLLAFACIAFLSCGDDDNSSSEESQEGASVNGGGTTVKDGMSPSDQKAYLDQVGKEFLNMLPASDFQALVDLGQHINKTYIDGKTDSWSEVEKWAKDAYDAATKATGQTTSETQYYSVTKIYTHYNALLLASNFKGRFAYSNGKWYCADKNSDLQFDFTDQNGRPCVLKLTTSGNVVPVHASDLKDYQRYSYDPGTGNYNDYYNLTHLTIGVPENIVVTLTQNGAEVVKTTVKTNLSGITNEEFDISKSSLTFSALVVLNNGYNFNVSQVSYTGNNQAAVSFIVSKGSQNLITIAMSSSVSGLPSWNMSAVEELRSDELEKADAKSGYVSFDLIGKVQVKGEFTNARKVYEYIEKAGDNDDSEATYKSYINQVNALIDMSVYYDGNTSKQATVKLEPFQEQKYYGKSYWVVEPVIMFYDGSSYSTFSAFFNETDFKSLIDSFKSVADQYANLINERIDWD